MLRISDLSSQSAVLPLFLFSNACKVHWKLQPGEVIAILNANLRPDDRGGPGKYTFSITNPDKLMRMGMSYDFTQCKGTVKATGKQCTNFAKKYGSDNGSPSVIILLIDLKVAVVSITSAKSIDLRWLLGWSFKVGEYVLYVLLEYFE